MLGVKLSADQLLENERTNCTTAATLHGSVGGGASSRVVAAALPVCVHGRHLTLAELHVRVRRHLTLAELHVRVRRHLTLAELHVRVLTCTYFVNKALTIFDEALTKPYNGLIEILL